MSDLPIYSPSAVTTSLVTQLLDRDKHGQVKYGTSMDRKDLTPEQWAQHAVEELLDGAGYLTALQRELETMRRRFGRLAEQWDCGDADGVSACIREILDGRWTQVDK